MGVRVGRSLVDCSFPRTTHRDVEMRKKRKIIQILATFSPSSGGQTEADRMVALCDDGTVWSYARSSTSRAGWWVALDRIPQDHEDDRS